MWIDKGLEVGSKGVAPGQVMMQGGVGERDVDVAVDMDGAGGMVGSTDVSKRRRVWVACCRRSGRRQFISKGQEVEFGG